MKKLFLKITNSHEVILKYTLVLTAIVIIVISLPKESQFNYAYQKGKPWAYENLMAPLDFAINKTEAELNEEKAQALKRAHPFYRFDQNAGDEKIKSFRTEAEDALQK